MAGRAVEFGVWKLLVHGAYVDRVEWVNVQNGFDVLASVGQRENLPLCFARQ